MADFESIADKTTEYVFGELTRAEREEFEAALDQSPELRAHVRELEEAALAIAASSPKTLPPKSAWRDINRKIAHDKNRKRIRTIVVAMFKNGWAAAAACIVVWLIIAVSADRSPSSTKNNPLASLSPGEPPGGVTNLSIVSAPNQIALASQLTNLSTPEAIHRETIN